MSKMKTIGTWVLTVLLALPLAAAGAGKLASVEALHEPFALLGLPGWFGYFIGFSELCGAIGLLFPKVTSLATTGIMIIMFGAIYFHISFPPLAQAIPAILFLILAAVVGTIRKDDLFLCNHKSANLP